MDAVRDAERNSLTGHKKKGSARYCGFLIFKDKMLYQASQIFLQLQCHFIRQSNANLSIFSRVFSFQICCHTSFLKITVGEEERDSGYFTSLSIKLFDSVGL